MKKRLSPYGGIIRIRFNGSDLSLSAPLSKRRQRYNFLGDDASQRRKNFPLSFVETGHSPSLHTVISLLLYIFEIYVPLRT